MKKRKVISILQLIIFAGLGYLAFDALFLHPPACEIDPKNLLYYDPNPAVSPVLPVIDLTYRWSWMVGYGIVYDLEHSFINWDAHFCFGKVALRTYFTDTWRAAVCPPCSSIRLLGPSLQVFVK